MNNSDQTISGRKSGTNDKSRCQPTAYDQATKKGYISLLQIVKKYKMSLDNFVSGMYAKGYECFPDLRVINGHNSIPIYNIQKRVNEEYREGYEVLPCNRIIKDFESNGRIARCLSGKQGCYLYYKCKVGGKHDKTKISSNSVSNSN